MPYSNDPHIKAMMDSALGKTPNPQNIDVRDIVKYIRGNQSQGGLSSSPTLIPAPTGSAPQVTPQPGLPGAWEQRIIDRPPGYDGHTSDKPDIGVSPLTQQAPPMQPPPQHQSQQTSHHQSDSFQPGPVDGLLSLDDIFEQVKRLTDVKYDPQIKNIEQQLERDQLQGEHQKAQIGTHYDKAQQDMKKAGLADQRQGADVMRNRGIYDSGLSMHLSNQIQRDIRHQGKEISTEQARVLSEVSDVLAQRHNQTNEQMQEIIANKSTEAQSLLWELTREERDFKQAALKDQFMMWLEEEKLKTDQAALANENEWKEKGFEFDKWRANIDDYRYQNDFNYRAEMDQKIMEVENYWKERGYDFDVWRANIDDYRYQNDFAYKVHADSVINAFKDREYQLQVDMFNNQITVDQFKMQMDQARFELEKQIAEWASRT